MRTPRRLAFHVLTIAFGLGAIAVGAYRVVETARDRAAVESIAATFALPAFAALPTDSVARLGETAGWQANDLRVFTFVSAVLAAESLPRDASSVRETVRSALLAGDYFTALETVRSVQAEFDALQSDPSLGMR